MDDLLVGMITHYRTLSSLIVHSCLTLVVDESNASLPAESEYIMTLFRDATASHLLETLFQHAPDKILSSIWDLYLAGKLGRLAVHPVANFVVTEAIQRLDQERLRAAVEEMKRVIPKCISESYCLHHHRLLFITLQSNSVSGLLPPLLTVPVHCTFYKM
jgi:hypothetical protein